VTETPFYRYFQHLNRIEELRRFQRAWFWDEIPAQVRAGIEREMDMQAAKATRIKIEEID
jgi:hypothetical protein